MKNMKKQKKYFFGICLVIFHTLSLFSQSDSAMIAEILTRIKAQDKEQIQNIGVISYNPKEIYPVYTEDNVMVKKSEIDSIVLIIVDGNIIDLTIHSEGVRYTNKKAPIALTTGRQNKIDALYAINGETDQYMIYQEIVNLSLDNSFIPEDNKVSLTKLKNFYPLNCKVGINTILDVRLYSDALGLVGGQSNGLAQTALRFKQILHRHNISNHGAYWFQNFKANLNLSKFDSKDKYTDSTDYSRSKLLQRSFVNAEMALDIFNGWLMEKKSWHAFYFAGGLGVNLSRISKKHDSVNTEITIPYWFFEAGISLKVSSNIGADAHIRYSNSYLPKNDFTKDKKLGEFYRFGVEIYYNPLTDKPSRIFARVLYTLPTVRVDQKNSFFQLQIGYSILLTKLLDKKK